MKIDITRSNRLVILQFWHRLNEHLKVDSRLVVLFEFLLHLNDEIEIFYRFRHYKEQPQ